MSGTFSPSLRIGRPLKTTNSGAAPTNASGLVIGDNFGGVTVSQEFIANFPAAASVTVPLYKAGIGGTIYGPSGTSLGTPIIATIPAGARIQNVTLALLVAPTAPTAGTVTINLNGTAIGTVSIGGGLGYGSISWTTTGAGLNLITYVGLTDAVLTAVYTQTAGTGTVGFEISVNYTARNIDGSIRATGAGTTNSGANAPLN